MSLATSKNQETLLSIKRSLPVAEAATREYKEVNVGDAYKTTRHKVTTHVVVAEVKRDKIKIKRDKDAKDSETISRAKFDEYYTKV